MSNFSMVDQLKSQHKHYAVIAKVLAFLESSQQLKTTPSLKQIGESVGLSEFHLHKIFSEWVGLSPKDFLQYLSKEKAKSLLKQQTLLNTANDLGLSGTSRLHDLMIKWEGMSPGEYKAKGKDISIFYGVHKSPFGWCFIAQTARGICKLAFFDTEAQREVLEQELFDDWSLANIQFAPQQTEAIQQKIFQGFSPSSKKAFNNAKTSNQSSKKEDDKTIHLLMKGSPFQIKVWEALLSLPEQSLYSYGDLAKRCGMPQAHRAVSTAVASNNIGVLIPCHRVIRSSGQFNQYRWGASRKRAIIAYELSAEYFATLSDIPKP